MSIWTPGKIPQVGSRFAMGVYLNYRKLSSGVQIPSQRDRMQLHGKVVNYFPFFDMLVEPSATQRSSFSARGGLVIVALMGGFVDMPPEDVGPSANGFTVQFYDATAQILWSQQPVNSVNQLGTGSMPFWLRSPYVMKPNTQLSTQVQNLSPNPSQIQIVAMGYQN